MAMLTDGKEPQEGSGLDVVVGDIRDRSSLTPSLFKVSLSPVSQGGSPRHVSKCGFTTWLGPASTDTMVDIVVHTIDISSKHSRTSREISQEIGVRGSSHY